MSIADFGAAASGLSAGLKSVQSYEQGEQSLEQGRMQMEAQAMQMREAKVREEQLNRLVPVTDFTGTDVVKNNPKTAEFMLKAASPYIQNGPDGSQMIRARDLVEVGKQFKTSADLQSQYFSIAAQETAENRGNYKSRLDELNKKKESLVADMQDVTKRGAAEAQLAKLAPEIDQYSKLFKESDNQYQQLSQAGIAMNDRARQAQMDAKIKADADLAAEESANRKATFKTNEGIRGFKEKEALKSEAAKNTALTEDAVNNEAMKSIITGSSPTRGMGGQGNASAILNAKAKILQERGITPAMATSMTAAYKADSKALGIMTNRENTIGQAELQAQKNADQALIASQNYSRTDFRKLNELKNKLVNNAGTPEEQAKYGRLAVAINAFGNEYMKVTTGGAASQAELSVGAQAKISELLSTSDSQSTFKAKVDQMKKEMQNSLASHKENLESLKSKLDDPFKYYEDIKTAKAEGGSSIKNNPLNIKLGPATKQYVDEGLATPGRPGTDGGRFLDFSTKEAGLAAAKKLLLSNVYSDLPVDAAMKKWSNNGYGVEIAPDLKGKKISDLTAGEQNKLIIAMAKREGNAKAVSGIQEASGAPKAGSLIDGWKFKGGDPADKNNWIKG